MRQILTYLLWHGRMGIIGWWITIAAAVAIWLLYYRVLGYTSADLFAHFTHGKPEAKVALLRMLAEPPKHASPFVIVISIAAGWLVMVATIKRYHDLGKTGLLLFGTAATGIGIPWVILRCGVFPGTEDDNEYNFVTSQRRNQNEANDNALQRRISRPTTATAAPVLVEPASAPRRASAGGFGKRSR